MASSFTTLLLLPFVGSLALGQDLPKRDGARDTIDPEPKLMLNDLGDIPLPPPTSADTAADPAPPALNVAKLEADVEKAKRNAAWRERLYKSGVFAKVEVEASALKVVRLTKDLEAARLQVATDNLEALRKGGNDGKPASLDVLAAAETAQATAKATAADAAKRWNDAERAAAELRVQRERKLLALGAGTRSGVKRAEDALQTLISRATQPGQ